MHPLYSFDISLSAAASGDVLNRSPNAISIPPFMRRVAGLVPNLLAVVISLRSPMMIPPRSSRGHLPIIALLGRLRESPGAFCAGAPAGFPTRVCEVLCVGFRSASADLSHVLVPEQFARLDIGGGAFKAAHNSAALPFGKFELQRTPKRREITPRPHHGAQTRGAHSVLQLAGLHQRILRCFSWGV
jgi:hypothetical protein